ncbi:MAG: thioredoxin domain-containing protein [Acidobacteria bacterium]|nr:thioredoxin domain-containing protein [Acidobacteriota bacterium]
MRNLRGRPLGWITGGLVLALACSVPAQQTPPTQDADAAARVGDRTITMKEIEDRWRQAAPAERAQALQQIYDGRKEALDAIIADMLIEQAAEAKGVPNPTQFTEAEIARRVKPVTDEEVVTFFQENQSQMQGRGLAAMGPVIRRFLEDQQRTAAYQALIAELRKAGPPVRILLDPPRYEVAVAAEDPVLGAADAPVTLVEFSDFQCPFCQRLMPTLKRLRETYGDRIRIVWKDFPLTSIHPEAFKAAEAGNCAREQGKFWEYHDLLFGNQQALEPAFLTKYAADAGLDAAKFAACLDTAKYSDRVQEQMGIGNGLGVSSTPSTFVNGRLVGGAQPYEAFVAIIEEELERARSR